ncbi:MAG TPA: hypothetical protein VM100_10275 [Longimicrobiales bacterium]|nr:hypothetical protein [Longimicrobiales bacterium]
MARYDRIAPLNPPARDNAFPGWWILRDLEGLDRDVELSRRARLRFLALRPVLRLVETGTNTPHESYIAQIDGVREQLGYLPARDAERSRLARFLHQIEDGELAHVASATLDMADGCALAGHLYGAEEYASVAASLAEKISDNRLKSAASAMLAHVHRMRDQLTDSAEHANAAVAAAEKAGDFDAIVRAKAELALTLIKQGETPTARKLAASHRPSPLAAARLASLELSVSNPDAALEHGVPALRQLDDLRERALLLEVLGRAFTDLGLYKAAERCFTIVAQRGVDAVLRARARAALAVCAASRGDVEQYRERRTALLNDSLEWADPRVFAFIHLELGRASMITRDVDFAREHLRLSLGAARKHHLSDIIARVEEVISALERNAAEQLIPSRAQAAEASRRIAEQFESLPDIPVIA